MTTLGIYDLPPLMLSGNFPDSVTFQGHNVPVTLLMNGQVILEETYSSDSSFTISLKFKELLNDLLKTNIPISGDYIEQTTSVANFEIHTTPGQLGVEIFSFTLVKGGIDSPIIDCTNFLLGNFLTWKPQVKKVHFLDPQWLTYYTVAESNLYVQATYLEEDELITSDPLKITDLAVHKKWTINTKFERLWQPFNQAGRSPYYIDVWIADEGTDRWTYVQRYVLTDEYHEFDDLFIFENSLGGVDVIRFTGELERVIENEFKSAYFQKENLEYAVSVNQSFNKNTGYFRNPYEILWTIDFFASINRYHLVNSIPRRIVLKKYDAKDMKTELNHYEFTFSYSEQSKYLNNETILGQLPSIMGDFIYSPQVLDDIYVRIFGDQVVDGVKTFLQPVHTDIIQPVSGSNLILNGLVVEQGGTIDCGEF